MINIGITIERLPLPSTTPVRPVSAGVVAFYGDSFAEGSSGGGDVSAYNALQPTLRRYLLATGTGYRTVNHAVSGSSSEAAVTAWLGRAMHRQYNYVCAGRNDAGRTAVQILANIDAILADRHPGEIVILGSVHNYNNGSENPGRPAMRNGPRSTRGWPRARTERRSSSPITGRKPFTSTTPTGRRMSRARPTICLPRASSSRPMTRCTSTRRVARCRHG